MPFCLLPPLPYVPIIATLVAKTFRRLGTHLDGSHDDRLTTLHANPALQIREMMFDGQNRLAFELLVQLSVRSTVRRERREEHESFYAKHTTTTVMTVITIIEHEIYIYILLRLKFFWKCVVRVRSSYASKYGSTYVICMYAFCGSSAPASTVFESLMMVTQSSPNRSE